MNHLSVRGFSLMLEEFHTSATTRLRGKQRMSNNTVNRFLEAQATGTWNISKRMCHENKQMSRFWHIATTGYRLRVDDLLVILCSLARCPNSRFITTESVTAEWHQTSTHTPHKFWWETTLLHLCANIVRDLLFVIQAAYSVAYEAGKTQLNSALFL